MAQYNEQLPLLKKHIPETLFPPKHISVIFAVACIIDQFGVNPIIVLPRGIILCGWVGYPLAFLVFSLTIYTAMLLGKCWVIAEHLDKFMFLKSRYAYSALTEMAWGKPLGKVVNILINISVFSSNIPALLIVDWIGIFLNLIIIITKLYVISIITWFVNCCVKRRDFSPDISPTITIKASQNLQFFDAKISNYTFNFSYCYWLIILGVALCPLTWLGSPKDTKWISVISTFSVFACALLTWICMIFDETRTSIYDELPSPNWQGISVAFGILTFQFGCHPAILTIQTDMHNKNKLSTSIILSFIATGSLSLITIWMSSVLYGAGTHANLTQGLPVNLILYFDILIVTLQLFLSTIVGQCTLFQDVEDKLGIPRELCWQRCVVRSFIVFLVIIFAEVLPRFDLVMGVIGGMLTGPITLIFPPLLYMRFRKLLCEEKVKTKKNGFIQKEVEVSKQNNFLVRIESHLEKQPILENKDSLTKWLRIKIFMNELNKFVSPEVNFNDEKMSFLEILTVFFIVAVGVLQTITATYYSTKGAIQSTKLLPPCIVNVEAASGIINA